MKQEVYEQKNQALERMRKKRKRRMKRSERLNLLKEAILEHSRHDLNWYLQKIEELASSDLSDPKNQNDLKLMTNIVVDRVRELEDKEEVVKQKPIGFRLSQLASELNKLGFATVAAEVIKIAKEGEYGGKGPFALPDTHKAFMKVPKGGSSCLNCKWVDEENHSCGSKYYADWNGGDHKLPDGPLDEICSDWFEPK